MENHESPLSPSINDAATSALLTKTCDDPAVAYRQSAQGNSNHVNSVPPARFEHASSKKDEQRKRRRLWMLIALLLIICFVLFVLTLTFALSKPSKVCLEKRCVRTAATLIDAINWTAEPCDDFYSLLFRFACGGWEEKHQISDTDSAVSNFNQLMENMESMLHDLLSAKEEPSDANSIKTARKFFSQCLDIGHINKTWKKAVDDEICDCSSQGWPERGLCNSMAKVWLPHNKETPEHVMGCLIRKYTVHTFLKLAVNPDDKNSSIHTLVIDQPGQPLHQLQYKNASSEVMKAYTEMVVDVFKKVRKMRSDNKELAMAAKNAEDVVQLEAEIAEILEPDQRRLEPLKLYKLTNLGSLEKEFSNIKWNMILSSMFPSPQYKVSFTSESPMVVNCWPYLERLNKLWGEKESDKELLYNAMYWRWFFNAVIQDLPAGEFADIYNKYNAISSGATQQKSRWRKCVPTLQSAMDKVIGAMYVREHFTDKTEKRAKEMVNNIMSSFFKILEKQKWLTKSTHDLAMAKANKIKADIAFPKYLKDNDKLDEEYEDYAIQENYFKSKFLFQELLSKKGLEELYQPVDKDKWITGPATVNAYYSPNHNSIVIPAGILQPVFYSPDYPTSMNYGGIGVVIGHELTHGFDDKGRMYDLDGNLKEWWDNATSEQFNARAKCIEEQYGRYKLDQIDEPIDGNVTKGENIADNGGLKESYYAFKQWEADNGAEDRLPGLESFSHEQLFFLNYAQIWCGKFNDQEARTKIRMIHSPGPIRVLGPLSNSEEFAKAYGCLGKDSAGNRWRMNPDNKCSVW